MSRGLEGRTGSLLKGVRSLWTPTDSGLGQTRTRLVHVFSLFTRPGGCRGEGREGREGEFLLLSAGKCHSASILQEPVEPKWPTTAVDPRGLLLFSGRPRGLWTGGLFGDGGNLGGLGPAAGSPRRVRGVGADGASVLQL